MPTSSTSLAPSHLSAPDLALVALYLVAITVFGLQFSRKNKTGSSLKSYFLADNTIPWWAIALSIVSAETSTLTIVSIPGVAFAGNLGFLQVVLGYMLGRVVVAALFLPRYFRGEMLTAYQLIDRRFGPALHKLTAGLFLLTRAAAEGVRVFAISIVVSVAIGTGDTLSIAIISALTLLYTFEGGMAAVIWTDVVQMALYVAGTVVALITLGAHVPGGWAHIHAVAAPLGKFHWLDFSFTLTKSYTFWAGVLGGTFLTMASHGTDQLMVQRMLAARNLRESRLALLSSGVVIFAQFTLFLLIGVGLYVFYATHPTVFRTNDYIFPTFIVHEMPHGIAGLLIAAILAAAMSNLSAALNSLASTTVIDFYVPFLSRRQSRVPQVSNLRPAFEPATTPTDTTSISRAATIFWAVVLFAIAIYAVHTGGRGHVVETGLSIASVAYGCLLGVFLLGTLARYATQMGAILGMIAGLATNLALWQASLPQPFLPMPALPHIAFTWYVLIGSAVTFAVGSLFSIALPRRPAMTAAALLLLAITIPAHPQNRVPQVSLLRPGSQPATNASPAYDFTPVSTLLNEAIAAHKLPGAVVLIGHNGKIVFEQAYGNRKLAGEPGLDGKPSPAEPMTTDTIFDMASLTKVLVTTTAILQLYEQGKLDLDTPVAHYLPEFGAPSLLSSRSAAEGAASLPLSPQATAWKQKITIRQLLTHYSGLPEDISLKDDWGLKTPDKAEGIRRAMASVPYGPPGQTFKYSDINFITLGALVEGLSGQKLDSYARQNIFNPLGIAQTAYHAFTQTCGPATPVGAAIYPGPKTIGRIGMACPVGTWNPNYLIPQTAPTAHDDQGTPATNPDFDHLLRGTVHDPTTRRMGGVAGHAGVFSTAEDASRFCAALLQKLRDNTGPFPLKQSTLREATSPQAPATAATNATIFTQDGQTTTGVAQRGLGWDINSPFSRPRGSVFPIATRKTPGSFGHTGFTGTSLWLDPVSDTYVILLSNAIHPRGAPPISTLRGQVATASAQALGLTTTPGAPGLASETWVQDLPQPSRNTYDPNHPCNPLVICDSFGAPPIPSMRSDPSLGTPDHGSLCLAGCSIPNQPSKATQLHLASTPHETAPVRINTSARQAKGDFKGGSRWIEEDGSDLGRKPATLTGIDVLEQTDFAPLKALAAQHKSHLRIGLLTNQSGLDSQGRRTIDMLAHASPAITLATIFTPEHGLRGKQDTDHLAAEQDPATHIPVISVYGPRPADKHPKQADLKPLDAIVVDLQDAGVRFWTYEALLGYFLEATAQAHIPIFVLDRPNPIGGVAPQGPLSDLSTDSYIAFMPLPVRHGLTFGELARYFNAQATEVQLKPVLLDARALEIGPPTPNALPPATQPGLHASLTVIPMQNWQHTEFFADTGLPWTPPSPNLRTLPATILYPGLGLTEQTNISVGRGTATPFENLGAPFVDGPQLAGYLESRHIPGVHITPTTLTIAETPEHYPAHGQTIAGIHLEVTDRALFDSPEFGIELLAALHKLYPTQFLLDRARTLLANADTLAALKQGQDPRTIARTWLLPLARFSQDAAPILLYPR